MSIKTVHYLVLVRNLFKAAGDFWSKYQCNEMFDMKYAAVDADYERQNILGEMLLRSLSIARLLGLKVRSI